MLCLLSALSEARQVVVAKDGSGQCGSIQQGIAVAQSGDTVAVKAGTYNEQLKLKSGITLLGAGWDSTKVELTSDNIVVLLSCLSNVTIKGLHILHRLPVSKACDEGVILVASCHSVRIQGCRLEGCGKVGICFWDADSVVADSNDILSNEEAGVYIDDSRRVAITRNLIRDNKWAGIRFIFEDPDESVLVKGNTIVKNGEYGIFASQSDGARNIIIEENVIAYNNNAGVSIVLDNDSAETSLPTMRANDLFANVNSNYLFVVQRKEGRDDTLSALDFRSETDFSTDPKFVDAAKGDFRLAANSPLCNAARDGGYIGALPPVGLAPAYADSGAAAS